MSYQDFIKTQKEHSTQLSEFLNGTRSAPTFDTEIDFASELQAATNATTAEQKIHLSNALYDQIAVARSVRELYKSPSDYFAEYKALLDSTIPTLDNSAKQVQDQHDSVKATIGRSNVNNKISKQRVPKTDY